ncbi:hypothetical protein PZA11_007076 [Diplocarpon coronariae]
MHHNGQRLLSNAVVLGRSRYSTYPQRRMGPSRSPGCRRELFFESNTWHARDVLRSGLRKKCCSRKFWSRVSPVLSLSDPRIQLAPHSEAPADVPCLLILIHNCPFPLSITQVTMFKKFVTVILLVSVALAKVVTYDWSIDWVTAAPDNFTRQVIGINGRFPLPDIQATAGDNVIINVFNNLGDESTSIHFHGIDQSGTQFSDGPSGVTQCPIPPGASLKYDFIVDKPGTYWYHSHNRGQYPDGLRGALLVADPSDPYAGQYDEELVLTLSDWYHTRVPTLITSMLSTSNPLALPPFPDALLVDESSRATWNWTPGKTYKVHIISFAAFASVFLEIDGHPLRIIAVDGSYTVPEETLQLRVLAGQRYTVLIEAQYSTSRNYAFLACLDVNRDFTNTAETLVWPHNITGQIVYDPAKALAPTYVVHQWRPLDDFTLVALDGQELLGSCEKVDKEITLDFNFQLDATGVPRTYFNNITYIPQKVPTFFTAITAGTSNTDPAIYGAVNPFVVSKGDIVQITINNLDVAIHPFHLHGHQVQVVERPASGQGRYSGQEGNFPAIPMKRDTYAVNANSYAVIRFQANNPGVWLIHCHIEWHVIMGLTATIIEAPELLQGISIPADHKANCDAQGIPTAGNAAGNTVNYTDLTGANTTPEFPDAILPKRMVKAPTAFGRSALYPRRPRPPYPRRVPAF